MNSEMLCMQHDQVRNLLYPDSVRAIVEECGNLRTWSSREEEEARHDPHV